MEIFNQYFTAIMTLVSSLSTAVITYRFSLKKYKEEVKMDKVFSSVEKLYAEISNLTLLGKRTEIKYNNNKDKHELINFFDTIRLELVSIKRTVVLSAIWLPNDLIKKIDDAVVFIHKEIENIYSNPDIAQDIDDVRKGHAFSQYFNSFYRVLMEQEQFVRESIKKELKIDMSL